MAEYKLNKKAGVVVVIVCLAAVLIIYHFTVGTKVSKQTTERPTREYIDAPLGPNTPDGPSASHAQPGPTETPVPRPPGDKRPAPPGQ